MDKKEILEKSRIENQNKDVADIETPIRYPGGVDRNGVPCSVGCCIGRSAFWQTGI
jgi:hypothetical protein